jgi:PAS domain-containing protein
MKEETKAKAQALEMSLKVNSSLLAQNEKLSAALREALKELAFQNEEKGKRASELGIANIELAFQHKEKGKRASELVLADLELAYQQNEKEKKEILREELAVINDAVKHSSQYARSLIESSLDPLVTISAEGTITDVNEASVLVTGVSREELIGNWASSSTG